MYDEIKEILEDLRNKNISVDDLTHNDKTKLLDYITNLQKANEILKENAIHNDKVVDKAKWNEMIYKSRIAKAKEYIMSNLITEWNIKNGGDVSGSDLPADEIIPILNILNGGDEE